MYLHPSDIFAKYLFQIEWPMSLAPMYEAIKREISGKPQVGNKPAEFLGTGQECKNGLLRFFKRNICESSEMQSIMHLDHEGVPSMSLSGALSLNFMFTLDIFVV